jgi:molybdate transport system substrate-binding protein
VSRPTRRRWRSAPPAALALALAGLLCGCGAGAGGGGGAAAGGREATEGAPPAAGTELVVLAAASLTDTFGELAAVFEAENPGVDVTTSFAGSSQLAQQVVAGAPADVLATASPGTMATVADAGLTDGAPTPFARNAPVLAVPEGNPAGVDALDDLADPDLVVALCAEQVPCGAASAALLDGAGVVAAPDTLEQDVRGVLTRLGLGEVDAGIVYRTDALAAADAVDVVEVPGTAQAATSYLVAPLTDAGSPDLAAAFVDLVVSARGQQVLADAGFEGP